VTPAAGRAQTLSRQQSRARFARSVIRHLKGTCGIVRGQLFGGDQVALRIIHQELHEVRVGSSLLDLAGRDQPANLLLTRP
jgi:hypothetical protein